MNVPRRPKNAPAPNPSPPRAARLGGRGNKFALSRRGFLIRTRAMVKASSKIPAAIPIFVRSIRQWRAGFITIGHGARRNERK